MRALPNVVIGVVIGVMIAVVGGAGCGSNDEAIENYAAMVCGCKTDECMDEAMGRFSKFRIDHPELPPGKVEKLADQTNKCYRDLEAKLHPRPPETW